VVAAMADLEEFEKTKGAIRGVLRVLHVLKLMKVRSVMYHSMPCVVQRLGGVGWQAMLCIAPRGVLRGSS
jgi:predicted TIM-barrel fold metal-dependent hydrolase